MTRAPDLRLTRAVDMRSLRRQRQPALRFSVSGMGAALIAFIAAWEPNAALRYGPFIAVGIFLLSRPLRFRIGLTEWALALLWLWVLLSQYWTEHPDIFESHFINFSALVVIFVGVRAASRWGQNEAIAVGGYVIGCLYGLAQTSLQLITGAGQVYRDTFGRITQVGALNINHVAYTTVGAIVLLLLALQSGQIQRRRLRMLALAALAILVVGGLSTQTRGVQMSIALLGLWLLISKFGQPVKTIIAACMVAILSISFGWVDEWLGVLESGDRTRDGLSGRLPLWEWARSTWAESIIVGAGLGADRAENPAHMATHNTILGVGVTLGAVGLALFLTVAISSLNDRIQSLSDPIRRFRVVTIIVAFTPILLTGAWEWLASGWVGLALFSTPFLAAVRNTPPAPELAGHSARIPAPANRAAGALP